MQRRIRSGSRTKCVIYFKSLPEQTSITQQFHERVHPDDQPLRDSAIKRAIKTKGGYEIEYRILLPDGTVRWISGRARCMSDGDGRSNPAFWVFSMERH